MEQTFVSARSVGIVVIGRNEGERLQKCLSSLAVAADVVVYVDSGSTDQSPARVRERGFDVVDLDMRTPFTAGRARNVGFERLLERCPNLDFVQFVDGDCELDPDWLDRAYAALVAEQSLSIVCGRRRERYPEASPYNRMCDVEWDTPVGEASACGGDFMVKVPAFRAVAGFDPSIIAGEEPEMCHRIRAVGGRIERLDCEMSLHDADMTSWRQWSKRAERAGYAYMRVAAKHAFSERRIWLKQVASILFWSLLPVPLLILAWFTPFAWVGFLAYGLLFVRIDAYLRRRRGLDPNVARRYALACVLGKFFELRGSVRAARDLVFRRQSRIIEYKALNQSS